MAEDRKYLIERIVNLDDVLIAYPPRGAFRDGDDDEKSYQLEMPLYAYFVNRDVNVPLSLGMVVVYNVHERDQRFYYQVTQAESGKDRGLRAKRLGVDNSAEEVRAERALHVVPLHPE